MLEFWRIFWLKKGRCPRCFNRLNHFSDIGMDYDYCPKCNNHAYYEDFIEIEFRD